MLTVMEVAEKLGVTTMTVYRLIGSDKIKAVTIGRSIRISQEEVNRIMTEGTK